MILYGKCRPEFNRWVDDLTKVGSCRIYNSLFRSNKTILRFLVGNIIMCDKFKCSEKGIENCSRPVIVY